MFQRKVIGVPAHFTPLFHGVPARSALCDGEDRKINYLPYIRLNNLSTINFKICNESTTSSLVVTRDRVRV